MEQLPNGFTLQLSDGAFPLSTDSMILADFVRLHRKARVVDLGAGCGTLGLLLCAKDPACHVTGIELDPSAHRGALDNIQRNDLIGRLESICMDLRNLPGDFSGKFDVCISNPPYFSGGPASQRTPVARHDHHCSTGDLFAAAGKALKFGGDFFLVHKPERLAELIARGSESGLEAKRLQLLRHRTNGPVSLILLQLRKGAKPGLSWQEESLFDANGSPTDYYRRVYHLANHPTT